MATKAKSTYETAQSSPSGVPAGNLRSGDKPAGTLEILFSGKTITTQYFSPQKEQVQQQQQQPAQADITPALIFTHGAGGGISSPATYYFAKGFANEAAIVLFQGSMNLQSRVKYFHKVIEHFHHEDAALALGGRSMGARAAVLSAQGHETRALVLASYPLIGQNGKTRDDILFEISDNVDVLFISGDQDHMCKIDQLREVMTRMQAKTWLVIVQGADHGMSLKSKAGIELMGQYIGTLAAEWLNARDSSKTSRSLNWNSVDHKIEDSGWENMVSSKTIAAATTTSTRDELGKRPTKPEEGEVSVHENAKKRRKKA